jgi:hypothetical protein
MGAIPNEQANTHRYHDCRVGIVLDELFHSVMLATAAFLTVWAPSVAASTALP